MKPQVRGRRAAQTPRGGAVSPRTDRRAVPPPRPPGGGSQGPLCSGSARSRAPPRTSPWRRGFWKQVRGVSPQPHHGAGGASRRSQRSYGRGTNFGPSS